MGYAWNGTATVQPTAASLKGVVRRVLGSAATGYGTKTNNSFFQPPTNGTAGKVPQQPFAQAYVYDWLAKAVNPTWPALAMYANELNHPAGGLFDLIPGSATAFVPNSFGM